jgi:hypothetical protein
VAEEETVVVVVFSPRMSVYLSLPVWASMFRLAAAVSSSMDVTQHRFGFQTDSSTSRHQCLVYMETAAISMNDIPQPWSVQVYRCFGEVFPPSSGLKI